MKKIIFYYPLDKSYQDLLNETFKNSTGKSFDDLTNEERFKISNETCKSFISEVDKLDFLSKTNIFQHLLNEYYSLSDEVNEVEELLAHPVFLKSRELVTFCSFKDGEEDSERGVLKDYDENISYVLLPILVDEEVDDWIKNFEQGL